MIGNRDFDFITGHWHVVSRRLNERLAGCREWSTSAAAHRGELVLDGLGNRDEFWIDGQPIGGSFRFYDLAQQRWVIYWVATRDGLLQPPVFGRFDNGRGVFEGDDSFDGQPIRVRYIWSGTRTATPRWEQAFSADGGTTWETNWVMEFSRTPL